MKRVIENKLATLEKKFNPDSSLCGEVIIYNVEEGVPEDLLLDDSIIRVFIPENHRDPEFESLNREMLIKAAEQARLRIKAKGLSFEVP